MSRKNTHRQFKRSRDRDRDLRHKSVAPTPVFPYHSLTLNYIPSSVNAPSQYAATPTNLQPIMEMVATSQQQNQQILQTLQNLQPSVSASN